MVPKDLGAEVYRTVKLRGPQIDATWAPWWKAQALAIESVLRQLAEGWDPSSPIGHRPARVDARIERYMKREMDFVAYLESKR